MSFSDEIKINFNKLNADEAVLVLIEISNSLISEPVRLVNDSKNLVSQGHDFVAMPFRATRQSDVQGELPKVNLTIPNVGRELVKWIDSSGGGRGSEIKVMLARRSRPDDHEETLYFSVQSVFINSQEVNFNLIVQNNLVKKSCKLVYDIKKAAGLFV